MKKIAFILSLILSVNVIGQTIKNRGHRGKGAVFPKIALPIDIKNYSTYVKLTNKWVRADIYTNEEFKDYLKLTNLKYDPNFGNLMVSISPTISKISFTVKDTKEGKLIVVNCGMSVLSAIISSDKLLDTKSFGRHKETQSFGKKIGFRDLTYTIEKSEIDNYYYTDDKNKLRLTNSFITKIQRDKLEELLPEIKKYVESQLFLGMKEKQLNDFYAIKSKESNPTLTKYNESTEEVIKQLGEIETLDQARALKGKVSGYLELLNTVKKEFDINDKKQRKIVWTAVMNEALINVYSFNFDEAEKLLFKAIDLDIRPARVKQLMRSIGYKKRLYNAIFDENGAYRDDITLKYIASNTSGGLKSNNDDSFKYKIDEEEGYIIDKKGKRLDGEITADFTLKEKNKTSTNDNTQTGITMLGFGKTNYKFKFSYLKKGKEKTKKYNVKDEVSFCIKEGKECYDGFKVKGANIIGAMPFMGSDNKKFLKVLFKNEIMGIYDDISDPNPHHIVRLLKEDNGVKLKGNLSRIDFSNSASKFFKKCKNLKKKIKSGTYDNTYDDIEKMAKEYSECIK